MKKFLQNLIIVASIVTGLDVCIRLMFVGGIVQIINNINPTNGLEIAIGICKIVFCGVGGLIPVAGFLTADKLED